MNIALTDKIIKPHTPEDAINCSNEGEAVAIAAGYHFATLDRANVYMSADGFCNALNFITSWIIPEKIEMNIYVSVGRTESQHKVMTDILPDLIKLLKHDPKILSIELISPKS